MNESNKYQREEDYIIDGSPEISVGESQGLEKILSLFPALQNKNYQIYFAGSLISLIGTWLQIVAEGWLVLKLTNSAFLIGLVAALSMLPTLLFSLYGGVLVDRFPKKHILIFTQAAAMILALIYGLLTVFHHINIWEIGILAFLLGTVGAVDSPARQAFVPEFVEKDQLASAIALNSGVFNAARVIGPAVAGVLIAAIGTGGAFLLNGVSYVAVIIALFFMKVIPYLPKRKLHPIDAIKEGISYSWNHPVIRTLLIFTGVLSIFGWSYSTIMPIIAQNVFHSDATGLGYLYVASGLGALLATFIVSIFSKKISPNTFIFGGALLFVASLAAFTFMHTEAHAMICLFFTGFGLLSMFATMNTTIQHMVTDEVRGRVMSIYTIMFLGLFPLGNLEIGYLSEKFGSSVAIRIGISIVFIFIIYLFLTRKKISAAYKTYKEENIPS